MVEEILRASRKAATVLEEIRAGWREGCGRDWLEEKLKIAVCKKLMLSETGETDIRRLVIMSIKRQDAKKRHLPDAVIEKQIRQYDCHQTSLVAQRKVLLLLFVEKELGIAFTDEEAVQIETTKDLADRAAEHLGRN
mgnify:FL=1